MIDKLRHEITEFLQQHKVGHLALSSPEGPWASVVRFISAGLTLYLIEPRASDLVFYLENDPHLMLTVDDPEAAAQGGQWQSVQIFGTACLLAPGELPERADEAQTAYTLKNRQTPGVYVIIEVKPERIYRVVHNNGATHRDTIDIDTA